MPPRILVVEDHDDTRLMMAALLGVRGYGVETAGLTPVMVVHAGAAWDSCRSMARRAESTSAELTSTIAVTGGFEEPAEEGLLAISRPPTSP